MPALPIHLPQQMAKITQELIIETAETLIERTEKSEVTLSQIADELNITHAALYKHFKNKQELWAAVAKGWFNRMISEQIRINMTNSASRRKCSTIGYGHLLMPKTRL